MGADSSYGRIKYRYRDGYDIGWAIVINVLVTGLIAYFLPDTLILPVCGFLWGYLLARPYGLLDRFRRIQQKLLPSSTVHGYDQD